jgi:retron-type reverse transcriptase
MWQVHEAKVIALTPGGLIGGWKQSKNPVVTTNGEKSAEAIVPRRLQTFWEGQNPERRQSMNVTGHGDEGRKLHNEGWPQKVAVEQRGYAGAPDRGRMAENNAFDTDRQTDKLLEKILNKQNLYEAYKRVNANKGAGGVDGMQVDELLPYLKCHVDELIQQLREGKYKPNPVRRVEIPKEEKGKVRKLGIPTVVDRLIQQAIAQMLSPLYEPQFHEGSYGFRPKRGAHDALKQCQRNVDEGYVYVVDMDLEKFFDTVSQSKLIEVLSRTIKDGRVISLIHKYLNAGVVEGGMFARTDVGVPQGGICKALHIPPYAKQVSMQSKRHFCYCA